MNKSRDKINQPPRGQGKKQSPRLGAPNKLNKRSEVMQATDSRENLGPAEVEAANTGARRNPGREKAGR